MNINYRSEFLSLVTFIYIHIALSSLLTVYYDEKNI